MVKLRLMQALWLLACGLFVAGVSLPLISISKLYFFESSVSIIGATWHLLASDRWLIGVLIVIFSLLLPVLKIGLLGRLLFAQHQVEKHDRLLDVLHEYGRWSMLDVMVVAVLIVTVKIGALVSVQVHYGLYVFAASVLILMVLMHHVQRQRLN